MKRQKIVAGTQRPVVAVAALVWLALMAGIWAAGAGAEEETSVVARVNGRPVTQRQLESAARELRIPAAQRERFRDQLLEYVIDRELLSQLLKERRAEPSADEVEEQFQKLLDKLAAGPGGIEAQLRTLGHTRESLREEVTFRLAWRKHIDRVLTESRYREYFEEHRRRLDGTELHLRQIVLTVPNDADEQAWTKAQERLSQIRRQIERGELTFPDAARQFSMSPTASSGGDLGWIVSDAALPPEVMQTAYGLEAGQMSDSVRSAFGWHLLKLDEVRPGDLSLEDVRPAVRKALSDQLWDETVRILRETARIEK